MILNRLAVPVLLLFCAKAAAGEIGFASGVERNATAELDSKTRHLDRGSSVRTLEVLATDSAGRLRVQLFDRTLISLGPRSRVRLDRFVVKSNGSAAEVLLNATRGAFRFASGISESRAYRITTPAGTLGVRGTRFAFEVDGRRLRVSVSEGSVQVCPPGVDGPACRIARSGSDVVINNRRASIIPAGPSIASLAPPLLSPLTAIPGGLPRIAPLQRSLPDLGGVGSPSRLDLPRPGAPHFDLPSTPRLPSPPGGGLLGR